MVSPWNKSYDKPRQHVKKQRHYFAYKGLYSQRNGFSSSQVEMWESESHSVVSDSLWVHGLSTVHRIFQARILEWAAFPFFRGSFPLRDRTQVSHMAGRYFTSWATREAHRSESWTIEKAERWRIDAFKMWFWRRLLRVPWTARRSNQSILKEISPGCSLEGLTLKLKLQYFGHLMRRTDSLEKTLMLGKIEGRRRRGR